MQYPCDVCGELFANRLLLDHHKKNCTKPKNEDESSPFKSLFKGLVAGAVVLGGIVYTAVKVAEAIEKRNSERDSASTSGIQSYRGIESEGRLQLEGKREYSPPRLGGIGINHVDFRSPVTDRELNTFIDYHLQPTKEFNNAIQSTVGNICSFLQQHMKPDEVIKGGSQGKRTAVKGMCDIDLVMVLNELEDAEDLENELPRIRKDIRSKLTRYGGPTLKAKDSKSGLKFKVNGDHGPIKVDLLPTFGFTDLQTLYCEMRFDKSHSDFYRAALSKWQVDFVKKYPANVKNLIRLVKYWKKKMVRKSWHGQRIPNSYLMELITIYYWEENTRYSDGTFNTLKAFHGIMEALKDYQFLNIFWTENYSAKDIPSQILRQRPLVLDPANPTNNVCSGYQWEEIRQEAKNVLKSAMMEGVSSFSWK